MRAQLTRDLGDPLQTAWGVPYWSADSMELTPGTNHSVSLSGEDEAELRGYWDKLSASGTVSVPLEKAPWGDTFGMCVDQFGVPWLVNIAGASS